MSSYHEVYAEWQADPEGFWARAAAAVDWTVPWTHVLDPQAGTYGRWFAGGKLNVAWNCLDRHVAAGRGEQAAIIYDSPVTGTTSIISYGELLARVEAFAGVLTDFGVDKGDRVLLYMPMVPDALTAMLACARIGAIHSVVFGGFAPREFALRIDDAQPKLVVAASCGIEPNRIVAYKPMLDEAVALSAHPPSACLVLQRPMMPATLVPGRDYDLGALLDAALRTRRRTACVEVKATDPLYILYTSGTTGQPKGVVRDSGGYLVALAWSMAHLYGICPGEVFWTASDVGWVVGHSYIVYGPLLIGATTVLYEGKPVGTPDPGAFWRVCAEHRVAALFTAPTALRAIRREDPEARLLRQTQSGALRTLFLAGERADPDTVQWAAEVLGVPVVDHWWQTETGWAIAGNPVGLGLLPVKLGSAAVAMPGYVISVLDECGHEVDSGVLGNLAIRLPLPPGCLPTLWNDDERFYRAYLADFPRHYRTGDAGYIDEDGYVFVMTRNDDIINVAGHRLSTGAMEEALSGHPDVAECAVVGIHDDLKGQAPLGLVVLKANNGRLLRQVEDELVVRVREQIGPVAAFKRVVVVDRLPKTRSGKILRATLRQIADRTPYSVPPTIEDATVLDEIKDKFGKCEA